MGRLVHLRGNPHDETQALLPWYVTGQLDTADRLLVDAHLPTCATCREELAFERRLGTAIRDLPSVTEQRWDMATHLPQQADDRRWWQRPVRVAWFLGAQAAVILLCVGLVTNWPMLPSASSYHVLGDAPALQTGNIIVMFAPDTSDQAVRAAIEASQARLINGPTAAGAYVLAVAPEVRHSALVTLRAQRAVTVAEPIDGPAP